MAKFTFTFEDCEKRTIHYETPDIELLDEILPEFQDFLLGCGYKFDGNIEIINED